MFSFPSNIKWKWRLPQDLWLWCIFRPGAIKTWSFLALCPALSPKHTTFSMPQIYLPKPAGCNQPSKTKRSEASQEMEDLTFLRMSVWRYETHKRLNGRWMFDIGRSVSIATSCLVNDFNQQVCIWGKCDEYVSFLNLKQKCMLCLLGGSELGKVCRVVYGSLMHCWYFGQSRREGRILLNEKSLMYAEADVPNMFHSWEWSRPATQHWWKKMDLGWRKASLL